MSYIHFGSTLKCLREQQKVAIERLAYGIMPVETLDEIECGKYLPTKDMVDMLLSRLGVTAQFFAPQYMDEDAFEANTFCLHLKYCLNNHLYELAEKPLLKMSELPQFVGGTMRQTYLHGMASVCLYKDEDSKGALKYLREAIRITLLNFKEDEVSTYLLGDYEISIINSIADAYESEGKPDKAISLLEQLVTAIGTSMINMHKRVRYLAHVLYNLTNKLGEAGRREESLEECDRAIGLCEIHTEFEVLPLLRYNKAYNLFHLGKQDKVKDLIYQAYYGSLSHGDNFYATAIRENAEKELGIVFE